MDPSSHDGRFAAGAALLGIAVALAFFVVWPHDYVFDDGGIVLRYLDNFAQGGFFEYNLGDGPVFGLSSFLFGSLAGGLAATRLVSPEASAFLVNGLGVALSVTFTLLLLRRVTSSRIVLAGALVYVAIASWFFVQTAYQALEAPLHLAVALALACALAARRRRTFWLLAALAIVSKLDAAGIVAAWALLRAIDLWSEGVPRRAWGLELRTAALWGGVPLGAYVLATVLLFGGPLPQSMLAKIHHTVHPEDPWAFLQPWWSPDSTVIVVQLVVAVVGIAWAAIRRHGQIAVTIAVPLFGALTLVAMFLRFNPAERMPWYYVLPQTLLATSAVLALASTARHDSTKWAPIAVASVLLVGAAAQGETLVQKTRASIHYTWTTEPERMAVGRFVRDHAALGDRLYTGHGHTAREARIHTHDYSGLNSPEVTALRDEGKSPMAVLEPDWLIRPGLLESRWQQEMGYRLRASFYNRSLHGRVAWRVLARDDTSPIAWMATDDEIVDARRVEARAYDARVVHAHGAVLLRPAHPGLRQLVFGVPRHAGSFELSIEATDVPLARVTVPPAEDADLVHGAVVEVRVDLTGVDVTGGLRIRAPDDDELPFVLLEPVWLVDPIS